MIDRPSYRVSDDWCRRPDIIVLDYPGQGADRRLKSVDLGSLAGRVRYPLDEVRPRVPELSNYARTMVSVGQLLAVKLIVAYCAAGTIARELADACVKLGGERPRLVLINAEVITRADALSTARGILTRVGLSNSDAAEIISQTGVADLTARTIDNFRKKLVEQCMTIFENDVRVADLVAELANEQVDWLTHIAAVRDIEPPRDCIGEVHINSGDHECSGTCTAEHIGLGRDSVELFQTKALNVILRRLMIDW